VTLVLPFPDVVGVTQCWRAVATRKSTPAVSGDECSADAEGNRALGATDVNGLTDAVHHHRNDLVITRGQRGPGPVAVGLADGGGQRCHGLGDNPQLTGVNHPGRECGGGGR
jgi:hypothetical protein